VGIHEKTHPLNNRQNQHIGILGLGWLGAPLAKRLCAIGYQVFGTTTQTEKTALFDGTKITSCHWKEGSQLPKWMSSLDTLIINIPPTKTANYGPLMETLCGSVSWNCHIVFTSSSGIYSSQDGIINEHADLLLDSALYQAEEIIKNQLNFTVLRLAGLIGGTRHPIHFLSGKTVNNGNWPVNLLTLNDALNAIEKVLSFPATNQTYNVCNPEHPTKLDYYSYFAEKLKLPLPQFIPGESDGKTIDSGLFEHTFQFSFLTSIYER
jgi:nucleoside-diphosphate-sugar epimerase